MATASTLVATRYVPPGSYIGQLITPKPGQLAPEARIPCYIGRGSRLAMGTNLPIKRSFIFAQSLTFSSIAPFVATLPYPSNGDQQAARLFKADGTEVRRDQWSFTGTGLIQILINTEVFDSTATYYLDYQSNSRDVKDVIPVEDLREIVSLGNNVDTPQYREYTHFFIETNVTDPLAATANLHPVSTLGTIVADPGNTGTGTVAWATASEFAHLYARKYLVNVTTVVPGVLATGSLTTIAKASLVDGETFTIGDGRNTPVIFEFDTVGTGVAVGHVQVDVSGDTSADDVRDTCIAAINGVGTGLKITATTGGAATVTLTADDYGSYQNVTITDTVTNVGFTHTGMSGGVARAVTCEWSGQAASPGNTALPNTPLHTSGTKPVFVVTDDTVGSDTPDLELGLKLQLSLGVGATPGYIVSDKWTFYGEGPGLIEKDVRYDNSNQFAMILDPVADVANTGTTGSGLDIAATAAFAGTYNANYTLICTAKTNTVPGTRTATFVWGEAGDHVGINGTFVADEATVSSLTQTLSKGVKIGVVFPVAAGNFAIGDEFTIEAKAPKIMYQAKDNRNYRVDVTAATAPSTGVGHAEGTFVTDTPEGKFGVWAATGNDLAVTNPAFLDGHFSLPNNVLLAARNLFHLAATNGNRHAANDKQTFATIQSGVIDWSLTERTAETIESDKILTDVNGTVTGSPNTKYVILNQLPIDVNSVVKLAGSTPVTHTWINGTPYITFLSDPGEAIVVNYNWRSAEPDPGQTYFLTAKFLRPPESYNTPTLILDRQDGRQFLSPASVDNHLYVMNEIAWDNGVPGIYFIQVQDPDDDGIYTDADFTEAILASEAPRRITDITVLGQFSSLGAALNSVTKMNDPFERRERLCWVGCPIGTQIGNAETPGTIVYYSRNTLQVFGNSPAHGTRIIVGSTQATRDIRLEDGSTITVTLDGSFVAGAVAALVASFQSPGDTILRKSLAGFKTIETYGDLEDPRNLTLGGNQVVFLTDRGSSVYRIEEDETTDSFAADFKAINAMTQKQYVTKSIRNQVDTALIGIVVPSAQAGVGLIKGFVIGAVSSLVTRGVVGRFQDKNGNERPIDPDADIVVFRDDTDITLFHMFYCYWLLSTVKRIFGLYSVNSQDFGLLRG